jgi:NAD(P)-dependent dehydrogenase (short-subunit alcohol dehydrogenase family)
VELCTVDTFRQVMEVNFFGALRVVKAFLPVLVRVSFVDAVLCAHC